MIHEICSRREKLSGSEIFLKMFKLCSYLLASTCSCRLMHLFMTLLLWELLSNLHKKHFYSWSNNTWIKTVIQEEPFKEFEWTQCFSLNKLIKQQVFPLSVQNLPLFGGNNALQIFGKAAYSIFSKWRHNNIHATVLHGTFL